MSLYLTIDQGGHASRALVFDERGALIAQGYEQIIALQPQADWVEYEPKHLLQSVVVAIEKAIAALGDRKREIVAAGLATQRSTIVCWDRDTGDPLSPAISWQDRRAADWIRHFEPRDDEIHRSTGLFVTAHYGVSKLHWCLTNLREVREAQAERRCLWGPLASYLLYQLSTEKIHAVDPSNASRTLLWNFQNLEWDENLLDLFGLPPEPLPRSVPTVHAYGRLQIAGIDVPITVMTGDQAAALYAYGLPSNSTAYVNMGTGAFVQRMSGGNADYSPRLLTSVVLQRGNEVSYVLEGTVNGCGTALVEIERQLGIDENTAEREISDWMTRPNPSLLFVNGIAGLGSPFWVPRLKSKFIGEGTAQEKLVAVAESIVFLLQANLDEMGDMFIAPRRLFVTGGISKIDPICQCLADLSGVAVDRPGECEATARGTAFVMAGMPSAWLDPPGGRRFEPSQDSSALRDRYVRWRAILSKEIENARRSAR